MGVCYGRTLREMRNITPEAVLGRRSGGGYAIHADIAGRHFPASKFGGGPLENSPYIAVAGAGRIVDMIVVAAVRGPGIPIVHGRVLHPFQGVSALQLEL